MITNSKNGSCIKRKKISIKKEENIIGGEIDYLYQILKRIGHTKIVYVIILFYFILFSAKYINSFIYFGSITFLTTFQYIFKVFY